MDDVVREIHEEIGHAVYTLPIGHKYGELMERLSSRHYCPKLVAALAPTPPPGDVEAMARELWLETFPLGPAWETLDEDTQKRHRNTARYVLTLRDAWVAEERDRIERAVCALSDGYMRQGETERVDVLMEAREKILRAPTSQESDHA